MSSAARNEGGGQFFDAGDPDPLLTARLDSMNDRLGALEQRINSLYVAMAAYAEIARADCQTVSEQASAELGRERQRLVGLTENLHSRLVDVEARPLQRTSKRGTAITSRVVRKPRTSTPATKHPEYSASTSQAARHQGTSAGSVLGDQIVEAVGAGFLER